MLNPVFVEWMQGLPEGWVTDCGLSRAQALRCLGNGVVALQAAAAFVELASALVETAPKRGRRMPSMTGAEWYLDSVPVATAMERAS